MSKIIKLIALVLSAIIVILVGGKSILNFAAGFILSAVIYYEKPKRDDSERDNSIGKKTWH